ncbi:MAG: GH92 family glycosyl hydrolase, partial [Mycobacteriaceae bacterium]|nr:GH92 family glycosyl hydrolase [Mycobacteriaceae bacterium]
MRSRRVFAALLAVVLVIMMLVVGAPPTAYEGAPELVAHPVDHVDTLIGTGTGGRAVGEINNFPGASVPFGMVQYSPDTVDTYAGYDHGKNRSTGFSLTHASVGCAAFGDIPMLPTTTPIGAAPWNASEKIAHDHTELGAPGYYTVRFPDTGVTAELTATTRTGVGRFRYPRNGRPALLYVRSGGSLAGNSAATIQIGPDHTTLIGAATSGGFCGKNNTYTVYFAMRFSQPFVSFGTWDGNSVYPGGHTATAPLSGGYLQFPAGAALEVRAALSYVSIDGARANLMAEGVGSFDQVRAAAAQAWHGVLSRITVASADSADVKTFYTCLYHSLLHPNTFNDVDGRYLGFDGALYTVAPGRTQYTNFSDWDTYRDLAALQALLVPERASDMAQSLVNDAQQSGSLPRWALANAATHEMTGDSVVPLMVSFYAFGARNFDVATALRYMVNAATRGGVARDGIPERPGIATYVQRGYVPQMTDFYIGHWFAGASITLEWAVDDFAISRLAKALGDNVTAVEFQRRAQFWQNLFNPTTRYISPRSAIGFFPDGPGFVQSSAFGQPGFDEGNAEQYLWWVPQNIEGLVTALGGRKAVADRLDRFTEKLNAGPNQPHLWVGNEPGFGVPWLYNYIGQPWKTQQTVHRVRRTLFGPTPDGEPGNDDLGAMSSWYVWAALGLYPSTPGTAVLTVNTPLFDRAEIVLPSGQALRILAPGASGRNRQTYIGGLAIDGTPTDHTALPESIIETGGDLTFSLSEFPNAVWGTAASSAPPSFGAGGSVVTVNITGPVVAMTAGSAARVPVDLQRMVQDRSGYAITARSADPG